MIKPFKNRLKNYDVFFVLQYLKSMHPSLLFQKNKKNNAQQNLKFWFAIRRHVNNQINYHSRIFYEGKHPKHSRWVNHNQYLYDNVHAGERVIDIGCGASEYVLWLAEKVDSITGVDILPERVEVMRNKNTKENVSYEVMDVTKDLPTGEYDVAICSHVLEHLDDPVFFLKKLSQKVPRIIIKVPLEDTDWMKIVMKDIDIFWMDDEDHRREYTMDMLKNQLHESGWEIEEILRGYDLRCVAKSKKYISNE